MNDFTLKELQLIAFLCMDRKSDIGLDECELEGTVDLYRKTCAMIANYSSYKFTAPDDMESSALAWKYQHDE